MLYSWAITVDADTTEDEAEPEKLELSAGVITRVRIKFQAGCVEMVKARILHEDSQLVPTNRGGWVVGDDETVEAQLHQVIAKGLTFVEFIGISPDTSWPHTLVVHITVLPKWLVTPYEVLADLLKIFKRMLGLS